MDTGGVERFRTITKNYYHGSAVFIFVYSSHSKASLDGLVSFIREAKENVPHASEVLVGNVYGTPEPGVQPVEAADVDHFAEEHNISRRLKCELSVDVEEDVQQLFQTIAENLVGGLGSSTTSHEINLSGSGPAIDPACCQCC